jgi:HEPN domain-containing protein
MSDYAVDSRYPAPRLEITKQKAEQAIETARSIYEFVLKSLPELPAA